MFKAANRVWMAWGVFVVGLLIFGCGSGDILDENHLRYRAFASFSDGGDDDVLFVDTVQLADCDGNATTVDPEEGLTNLIAQLTIIVPEGEPGIRFENYKVTFKPLPSVDIVGNVFDPAPYPTIYTGTFNIDLPSNSESEFFITCMEADGKAFLGSQLPATAALARYEVTITMDFIDEFHVGREIVVRRVLYFGNVDNCT